VDNYEHKETIPYILTLRKKVPCPPLAYARCAPRFQRGLNRVRYAHYYFIGWGFCTPKPPQHI